MKQKILRTLGTIFVFFSFYLLFLSFFSRSIANHDLWGYLSFGKIFWDGGFFPYQDIFSYTPTKPIWVYHEWLTGIIFYYILRHSGPAGLQLLQYIIIIITLSLIYATAIRKGSSPAFALMALVPSMLLISFGYVPVRAQIFTYMFFILTVYILERARINQQWKILLWLLPVEMLWCNLHGGFVAGLGIILLYAIGEQLSRKSSIPFFTAFLGAGAATIINPYGLNYWRFMISSLSMPRPEISEWFSLATALRNHYQDVPIMVFIFLAFACVFFVLCQRKRKLTEVLIIAAMIYLGIKHVRHTIFMGIIFGAFIPVILNDLWKQFPVNKRIPFLRESWFPSSILAFILLYSNFFFVKQLTTNIRPSFVLSAPQSLYPIGALEYLRKCNLQGKILPDFDWGEFIMWTCYPHCKVAMDGRYETVYEKTLTEEYFVFLEGKDGWNEFLKKYPPDIILIKPLTRIYFLLLQDPAWREVYADKTSVLFIKNGTVTGMKPQSKL